MSSIEIRPILRGSSGSSALRWHCLRPNNCYRPDGNCPDSWMSEHSVRGCQQCTPYGASMPNMHLQLCPALRHVMWSVRLVSACFDICTCADADAATQTQIHHEPLRRARCEADITAVIQSLRAPSPGKVRMHDTFQMLQLISSYSNRLTSTSSPILQSEPPWCAYTAKRR